MASTLRSTRTGVGREFGKGWVEIGEGDEGGVELTGGGVEGGVKGAGAVLHRGGRVRVDGLEHGHRGLRS